MTLFVKVLENAALLIAGAVICYLLLWWKNRNFRRLQALEAESVVGQAKSEAELVLRNAQLRASEETLRQQKEAEQSAVARRTERAELERRLADREGLINSQLQRILDAEQKLAQQQAALSKRQTELESRDCALNEERRQLREQAQKIAGLSLEEARAECLKRVEAEASREAAELSRRILDTTRAKAEDKARQILSVVIQRYAGEHTFENTTATVALNGDDLKGRIIGREGRNIRAFEAATGVTVLIDDTPGAVLLSGFDPVRREVAREAMQRLILDGRIHPTRIEEIVTKVNGEMEQTIMQLGETAVAKTGLPPLHPEITKLLGRLRFRHSYSQNLLDHSVEVAQLMGLLAAELGVDVQSAKRAGLLHDIGKGLHHQAEGPHAIVGANFIKRYGESEVVVNGVASHHNDVPPEGPMGILVSAADAISASRPGARSENMTTYLQRVEDLEKIASEFSGVEKAFALQAGRELRVFVQPDQINDEEAYNLARNIAAKIQNGLQYPGQIKITVIRETRCIEVAK